MENYELILEAIEKLSKKLDAVPKSEERSTQLNELFTALAKAQSEMSIAGAGKINYYKKKYADLCDVVKASRPALTKNGLSVIQQILTTKEEQSFMFTILAHTSGQYITSRMRIVFEKGDTQKMGSYITYLRRYAYISLIGVVSCDDDDDGEVSMKDIREKEAKGTALNYNQDKKEDPSETINQTQFDELELELEGYPDIAENLMEKLNLETLADLQKSKYRFVIEQIRKTKQAREERIK